MRTVLPDEAECLAVKKKQKQRVHVVKMRIVWCGGGVAPNDTLGQLGSDVY